MAPLRWELEMAQIVQGLLQQVDREHGRVVIGADSFELLEGLPLSVELAPGTAVTALVADRGGARRLIHLQRYVDEWAAIRRQFTRPARP
jgi:hypothetical protein